MVQLFGTSYPSLLHTDYLQLDLQVCRKRYVTIHQPPHSIHFDHSGCLKTKGAKPEDPPAPEPPAEAATAAPGPNALPPQPPVYPQQTVNPPHYNAPPPPSWMYGHHPTFASYAPPPQYLYPLPANYSAFPYGQQPGSFPAWPPPKDSPAASPATALQLGVLLAEFCARYKVSKSDEEKLALLEYKSGNNAMSTLTAEDWKEVKSTTLGWKAFIAAHKQFIRDVNVQGAGDCRRAKYFPIVKWPPYHSFLSFPLRTMAYNLIPSKEIIYISISRPKRS
jgi:hypothetical protein